MPNPSKETVASRIFAHLTGEERIDQACELLAIGVLRLAEKRGLLKSQEKEKPQAMKDPLPKALHQKGYWEAEKLRKVALT